MWTSGKLATQFPRYIKMKKSADDDESRLRRYVYDHIGDVQIRDFAPPQGLELAERVMAALPPPSELSQASARHVAQTIHRVLGLAVYPLRILSLQPLPKGFLPRPANDKAKTYVYPDEDATLMRCCDVPLVERLFFGLLAREGARVGEVRGVQLYELDLEHGWGHLDETKNGRPKDWPLQPGTLEALKRYRDRFMPSRGPRAFVFAQADGTLLDPFTLAENLRDRIRRAGIARPQLYLRNENRLALRVHDLRASFVTVALANGKTESWVADRTGHLSSQMINRYKRWARGHQEQSLGDWVPLHVAIPELADRADHTAS
jgi:integrase